MNMTQILLDSNGVWYHDGVEVTHGRTLEFMFKNIYFENGNYYLKGEKMPVEVTVKDVAFFVRGINRKLDQIELNLSDGSREALNFTTLGVGGDNQLYCQIKNASVPARFERKAYNDLATNVTERDGYYGITFAGTFYPIQKMASVVVDTSVVQLRRGTARRAQTKKSKMSAKSKKTKTKKKNLKTVKKNKKPKLSKKKSRAR